MAMVLSSWMNRKSTSSKYGVQQAICLAIYFHFQPAYAAKNVVYLSFCYCDIDYVDCPMCKHDLPDVILLVFLYR